MTETSAGASEIRSRPRLGATHRPTRSARDYDDGGLVDINHVPADVLAGQLGLAPDGLKVLVAARDRLGAFSSTEELVAYETLSPDRAEELRNLLIFVLR